MKIPTFSSLSFLFISLATMSLFGEVLAAAVASLPSSQLTDRDTTGALNKDGVHCCISNGRGWNYAPIHPNFDPMFAALSGAGRIDIHPGCQTLLGCNRVAEVILCNDRSSTINPSKQYLRTYMDDIVNQCQHNIGGLNTVCGQNFDSDGYNVIMKAC